MNIVDNLLCKMRLAEKKPKEKQSLEKLPPELLILIFQQLEPHATLQFASASKTLRKLEVHSPLFAKSHTFKVRGEDIYYSLKINPENLKGIHLKQLLKAQNKDLPESMRLEYNTKEITDDSDVKSFKIDPKYHIYIKTEE